MALSKLYYVYGLDTSCFYTDEEYELEKKIIQARCTKAKLKKKLGSNPTKSELKVWKRKYHYRLKVIQKTLSLKEELKKLFKANAGITRTVRSDKILNKEGVPSIRKRVSIFDSTLVRTFGMKEREFNDEIVIVKVFFFEIAESIIHNGFYLNGEKYVFFSASAGQIRTKKLVAVKERLLNENWNRLTAGLTIAAINDTGGMNVTKFLAYLALSNSATDVWNEFDIDKTIVVDDFETLVNGTVDFIDDKTYETTRKNLDLPIAQMDGNGIMLPSVSRLNFMVRLPWVKGLLATFDFRRFIEDNNATGKVTDIYGVEHDVIAEDIQIIFTKSQFKMWAHFKDWDEYKSNFKAYNCEAARCNIEESYFPNAVINYQMIQSLPDLTDGELLSLAEQNQKDINDMATDLDTMLKVFGADSHRSDNNTAFVKCLQKYPELISDTYSRQTLRDIKNRLEKDLYSAKFKIRGKYTFVVPDLYAFCEWLFLGIEKPKGILKENEVCCRLFQDNVKLDCLRSPHLYCEHPIRINNTKPEWFTTNAIYVSSHDFISRVLQADFDGDKLLVTDNQTLIQAAERNMNDKYPLYYYMNKAKAEIINSDSLWHGLKLAYTGGNIGEISNSITKIWNSSSDVGDTEEKLKVIRWLCMENNFTIDYAKTLYKPTRPTEVNEIITKYTKDKVPHFFIYAKSKTANKVMKKSTSPVDRISSMFPKKSLRFNFKEQNVGRFKFKVLMNNPDTEFIPEIADRYKSISSKLNFNNVSDEKLRNYFAVFEQAKNDIFSMDYDKNTILDVIIVDLFSKRKTPMKKAFWILFGDMVYENICKNLEENYVQCPKCKTRFHKKHKNRVYCDKCMKYERRKVETITCIDCGKEFEVDGTNRQTDRCPECYEKYRTYKKKSIKTITCVDCGKQFEIKAKDNKTTRCEQCYEVYRRAKKNESQRLKRAN